MRDPGEEAIRVRAYETDRGQHVVELIVNGVIFITTAPSQVVAMEIARKTVDTLIDFRESQEVTIHDRSEEN